MKKFLIAISLLAISNLSFASTPAAKNSAASQADAKERVEAEGTIIGVYDDKESTKVGLIVKMRENAVIDIPSLIKENQVNVIISLIMRRSSAEKKIKVIFSGEKISGFVLHPDLIIRINLVTHPMQ